MNSVYKYILRNKALDNVTKALIEGKSIVFLRKNNKIDDLINYFNDFIINNFDEIKLRERINEVVENMSIRNIKIKKVTVLKREITNNKNNIIDIFSSFINKDDFGYSLNDLYSLTNKNIEFKDEEFEYYNILSKAPIILENERAIIINDAKYLLRSKYVNLFIKYSKFKDSKRFNIIKEKIDKDDIDKIINKLSGILNNTFAFIPPIYFNEYTSEFEREEIYYKNYNDEQMMEVVRQINAKHNGKILEEIVKVKWYNLFKLIKYKKISNENNLINEQYEKDEATIYNQYVENIENLKMFSNSFSFIKKVFKDEVLESIDKCIVNEEELYNYILYIKETLFIYKEYLVVKDKIESLSDVQIQLLSYAYDEIKNKNDLIKVLEFVPRYYLYDSIERMECDEARIITSYNNIDEKIFKLNAALLSYSTILLEVLKEISNKNTLEFMRKNKMEINKLNIQDMCADRYSTKNISFLLKLFPVLVLDENEYKDVKESIDGYFDLVINSEEFLAEDDIMVKNNSSRNKESLDKGIINLLSNSGYNIYQKEDNISIIYIEHCKCKCENKVLYINNKEFYNYRDLIDLLELLDEGKKIIFLWYRNWWLNRNEEIQNIQKLLLNNS